MLTLPTDIIDLLKPFATQVYLFNNNTKPVATS